MSLRAAVLGIALVFGATAQAAVIDFGGNACLGGCSNGKAILQTFGDTDLLNVSYNNGLGGAMTYWDSGYSGMFGIAYGASGLTSSITLKQVKGYRLTLRSFDLGSWQSLGRNSSVRILNGAGDVLFDTGAVLIPGSGSSFAGKWRAKKGVVIEFGPDAFNVGIDQIRYSLREKIPAAPTRAAPPQPLPPVPVPAGLPLLAGALGLLALLRRRRHKSA